MGAIAHTMKRLLFLFVLTITAARVLAGISITGGSSTGGAATNETDPIASPLVATKADTGMVVGVSNTLANAIATKADTGLVNAVSNTLASAIAAIPPLPVWLTNECRTLEIVGTNVVMDGAAAEFSKVILTNNVAIGFTNFVGRACWILLQQDAVGGHLIQWPDNLLWSSNAVLQVSTNAGSADIVKILHDGATYFAEINGMQYRDRPLAQMCASTTNPVAGASVTFTNCTLGPRTGSIWNFGDGTLLTNDAGTVTHTYTNVDVYTVSLTALGRLANSAVTNSNYITVSAPQYALSFDGSQNYATVPYSASFASNPRTVEFWLKSSQQENDNRTLFVDVNGSTGHILYIQGAGGNGHLLAFYDYGSGGFNGGTAVPNGEWRHCAMTVSGTTVKLWLDGVNVATATKAVTSGAASIIAFAQASTGCGFAQTAMDEIRMSDNVRYSDTFTPAVSHALDGNTIAYWRCNEGSGTTFADQTGNHNGTLQGDPLPDWVAGKE